MSVVDLEGLSVTLGGRPVLTDLRASLGGRAIGLLGPNGAGKTTLLRTLLGFFTPSSGSATVLGHDLAGDGRAIRAQVGYMPESDGHIAGLTAVHFVRLMGELSGLPVTVALERAHEALFWVGLGDARYRLLGTFSTGMKQKVKLAQAIVHGPRLLFLDEPTNGLDPPARKRMLELVTEIRDRGEAHLVLSSHLLRDVEAVCDQVLILKGGRVAACHDLAAERKANRAFVEVELLEPTAAFADQAAGLGCEVADLGQGRLKMVMPATVSVRELFALADRLGVAFRRLDTSRDSLQDIFLRAMEAPNGGL